MPSPTRTDAIIRAALAAKFAIFVPGNIWYVQSTQSDARDQSGYGKSPQTPFATLDYAIGQATANNGDVIVLMPGHAETISAAGGVTVDVAGLTIIGQGSGSSRPTFNFTATDATFLVTAANTWIDNCLFTGGIDAVVTMFTVSAADWKFTNCETRDVTGQMVSCITTTAGANRFYIDGWIHNGDFAAGGANALEWVGGDQCTIRNYRIYGNFSVAAIENVTTATTKAFIGSGTIMNRLDNAAVVGITMVATSTGTIGPQEGGTLNIAIGLDSTSNTTNITEAVVGAAMRLFLPINVSNLDGEVAMLTNITASTDA